MEEKVYKLVDDFVEACLIGFFLFIFLGMFGVILAAINYYLEVI